MNTNSDRARDAWKKFCKMRFVMLTTLDEDGGIYSCPMTLQHATDDGTLWFFTSTSTPTARAVERDGRAAVAVMDGDDFFASVYGSAAMVTDRAKMRELWNPMVKAWFPQGVEDPHLVLLRIDIERGEYWDTDQSSLLKMFEIGKALATHEQPDIGEKGTLEPASTER